MKVFLIGFMGSGKSSLGKKLAKKLAFDYIDLDQEIEIQTQKSITQIFEEHGEDYFRHLEKHALRATDNLSKHIISVGGGTPMFYNNMTWMNENGKTVYLKLTPEQLLSRLNQPGQIEKRPLLQNKTEQELLELIQTMLQERSAEYEKAQLIVEGFGPHELSLPPLLRDSFFSS